MSKMSQLAAELDELRHCGEILIGISDTLREMFSGGVETPEAQEGQGKSNEDRSRKGAGEADRAGKAAHPCGRQGGAC